MSKERFDHLLWLVSPLITKQDTRFRKAIPANERLALTLRYLASGESQVSLSFQFRLGRSTVSQIISECCEAIFTVLSERYLRSPRSPNEWKEISKGFDQVWNMKHVVGAIDGKHVRIKCPKNSGSLYHNYKGFFSLVILAVCDANYCFTLFDVGQYGSNNDAGILINSAMGNYFERSDETLPKPESVEGCEYDPLPYYLVGDEIFPLKTWMMRPFPGKLSEKQRIFNYRLSRARRVIENTFGILAARWRIFSRPIEADIQNAEKYTLACIALHNYLRQTNNPCYCPSSFVDCDDGSGKIKEGEWRKLVQENTGALSTIPNVRGSRYRTDAIKMRECLMKYLQGPGRVDWQLNYVNRT